MAYNSAYTGSQVDAAVGAVRQKETKWDNKQDELTGTEDQIVGFNSAGEAVAVAKPDPLPTGGETGQVLTKTAEGTAWDDIPSDLPAGGTDGQILTKTADGVEWEDAPEGGVTSFNSRTGAITPQAGDYTADMVGAIPTQTGTQGQVLGFTADNTVGAMDAPSGLPSGGTTGQMLYQGDSGPEWGDKPVMYVHITESAGTYSADKTFEEIQAAYNAGYAIFAITPDIYAGTGNVIVPFFGLNQAVAQFFAFSPNYAICYTTLIYSVASGGFVLCAIRSINANNIKFTPGQTGLTSENVQDAIEEVQANVDAYKPNRLTATLSASRWSGNRQTITVNGVITDTSAQDIDISCADKASADAWAAGGVWCNDPTQANRLTFTCTTPPTANINIRIRLWEVG